MSKSFRYDMDEEDECHMRVPLCAFDFEVAPSLRACRPTPSRSSVEADPSKSDVGETIVNTTPVGVAPKPVSYTTHYVLQ